jgi:hypothetical protein
VLNTKPLRKGRGLNSKLVGSLAGHNGSVPLCTRRDNF